MPPKKPLADKKPSAGKKPLADRKPSAGKEPSIDFETSLSALETLVNKMEQGEMSLEESLKAFETGIQLTRDCQTRLAAAEQQVQQLVEQQGKLSLEPLDPEDLENDR